MSNHIQDLQPEVQAKARTFLALLTIPYVVTSTLRTVDEQIAHYARGRASLEVVNLLRKKAGLQPVGAGDNVKTVTNCDGINTLSNHQSGRALDVVPEANGGPIWPPENDPRWNKIGQIGMSLGFTWGGMWKVKDLPHFELPA